jgi:hypothetical protein
MTSLLSSHPSLLIPQLLALPSPADLSWPPLHSSRAVLGRKCDRGPDVCQDCVRLPGSNLFWRYLRFDIPPRVRVRGRTWFWPGLCCSDCPRSGLLFEVRGTRACLGTNIECFTIFRRESLVGLTGCCFKTSPRVCMYVCMYVSEGFPTFAYVLELGALPIPL